MAHLTLSHLETGIAQLDQAIYNHEQWHRNLLRVLVAHLPPDAPDLMPDAHHRCRFGQWYDSDAASFLHDHPAFAALGHAHEDMHQRATRLLQRVVDGLPVSVNELDQFNASLDRLRLEIQSFRRELAEEVQGRDPLTGARNRTTLLSDLREQQALVRRGVQECTLAVIDLDHFKDVNDRHGHPVGDRVLASTVECIQSSMRPYDRLYRFGGEEFVLCLPHTSVEAASSMAERLRAAVAAQQIQVGSNPALQVTASFGLAALDGVKPVEEALDQADKALYEAKASGRNRVHAFS